MELSISNTNYGWTKEQRDFCLQQYHLNRGLVVVVRRLYCEKFGVSKREMQEKCPSIDKIKQWVKIEGEKQTRSFKKAEEKQKTEPNKLAGTQWGRKTGENRMVRTESIDTGLQHQTMKWKQRNIKWDGPRPPYGEQKEIEKPKEKPVDVVERWWLEIICGLEVKPDRKEVMQDKFEEDVLESVESLNSRGHEARASAFVSLRAALQRRAADGLLGERRVVRAQRAALAEHVARALRRGRDPERKAAAAIAPLLALQIGDEGTEQFVREVRPALAATATDKSASLDTRTECCSSLAVLSYLMKEDLNQVLETMRMFESIFSGSYLKDNGRVSLEAVEEGAWHAAALDGWALLLPLLNKQVLKKQSSSFARLGELLEVESLEVRMAAGGALAIAYETVTKEDNSNNALTKQVDELLPRLREMAKDSNKHHSKRDRRVQRATFRDILKYFESGEVPSTSVHMGSSVVRVCGWRQCAAHAALASALGGALQVLAPGTPRLRAALALPDQPAEEVEKPSKEQKHLQNKASCKSRNVVKNKNNLKRAIRLAS